ncbi:MAG: fatty acid desaturase, partial [Burkholderiales bacterium]
MLLRHPADRLSIAYVLVHVGLTAWGAWPLVFLSAILAVGVTNIAHHHAHRAMWGHRLANRATDVVLSALMGIPIFVFPASHIRMHHRRITEGRDATHPSRFGSENHFVGLLAHPFRVLPAVLPDLIEFVRQRARGGLRGVLPLALQIAAPIGLAVALATINRDWWWHSVLIPQLIGVHVLLAAN